MARLVEEDDSLTEEELLEAKHKYVIRLARFLKIHKPQVFSKEQLVILIMVNLKYKKRD